MNAWINAIAEMTEIGGISTSLSLSDLGVLVPGARCLMAIGVVAAFCLVASRQDKWIDPRENKRSDNNGQ